MNRSHNHAGGYSEQLTRLARSLAAARGEEVLAAVASGTNPEHVRMFTEDNVDKRREKLHKQLELLSVAFDDLDELLSAYIKELPLVSYDTGAIDAERFLEWVEQGCELSLEQSDLVGCQRARHAVEQHGRENRFGHVRFQELWSMADLLADELESNKNLRVRLNPIRRWSVFESRILLDDESVPPVDVLFYASGNEVRTAVLESAGKSRIIELGKLDPLTIDEWIALSAGSGSRESLCREEVVRFCRELAEMGLVAFS